MRTTIIVYGVLALVAIVVSEQNKRDITDKVMVKADSLYAKKMLAKKDGEKTNEEQKEELLRAIKTTKKAVKSKKGISNGGGTLANWMASDWADWSFWKGYSDWKNWEASEWGNWEMSEWENLTANGVNHFEQDDSDLEEASQWENLDFSYFANLFAVDLNNVQGSDTSDGKNTEIGPSGFPLWNNADFTMENKCSAVQPKVQGNVQFTSLATLPTECGKKTNKRRFLEILKKTAGLKTEERIVGGVETRENEWPWLVAIGHKNTGQFCGGTLISDQFVVTAAHCIKELEYPCHWNIRIGEHDLYANEGVHVDREAENIWVHPHYFSEKNDIAVIKLAQPVDLRSAHVGPACLPESMAPFPAGTTCYVAGWGTTSSLGMNSAVVRHTTVRLYSDQDCKAAYGNAILPGMICAGYPEGGKDACQGDSGGPLVCQNGDHWDLVGVVSWGYGCAQAGKPGVYASVDYYMHWIHSIIAENS